MTNQLIDNHGRPLSYLRLAVTDRCNLRCQYCIPHEKADFVPRKELLDYEEMIRLVRLLASMGISKVRITGGEPFVRKDILYFFKELSKIEGIKWYLTTNGVRTTAFVDQLKQLNISGINLSLDTLDARRFKLLTRRNAFESVKKAYDTILAHNIPLKINMVVLKGINDDELLAMASLAKTHPVEVRFIEEMPFTGEEKPKEYLNYTDIKGALSSQLELIPREDSKTAQLYHVRNWKGSLGIIPAFTRTFCGSCNRLRITATGKLKTCLYGKDQLNLKQLMSSGATDAELRNYFLSTFKSRAKDGYEAEKQNQFIHQSMATIGG